MKKWTLFPLTFVLVCLAACGGYAYGQYRTQQDLGLKFELLNYSAWAAEGEIQVELLKLMAQHKNRQATAKLERVLDVTLASLAHYDRYAGTHPDPRVFRAIRAAKAYRAGHPAHRVGVALTAGVRRSFAMVK